MQRSWTFDGPVRRADQEPRDFVDQQAASRAERVGAIPFTQIKVTRSGRELRLDDLADPASGPTDSPSCVIRTQPESTW